MIRLLLLVTLTFPSVLLAWSPYISQPQEVAQVHHLDEPFGKVSVKVALGDDAAITSMRVKSQAGSHKLKSDSFEGIHGVNLNTLRLVSFDYPGSGKDPSFSFCFSYGEPVYFDESPGEVFTNILVVRITEDSSQVGTLPVLNPGVIWIDEVDGCSYIYQGPVSLH